MVTIKWMPSIKPKMRCSAGKYKMRQRKLNEDHQQFFFYLLKPQNIDEGDIKCLLCCNPSHTMSFGISQSASFLNKIIYRQRESSGYEHACREQQSHMMYPVFAINIAVIWTFLEFFSKGWGFLWMLWNHSAIHSLVASMWLRLVWSLWLICS